MKAETIGATQVVVKTVITSKDTLRLNFLQDSSFVKKVGYTCPGSFWRDVISMTSDSLYNQCGFLS